MPGIFVVLGALLVALAVDRWWGEPPVRWHPVVWMGNALERCTPWVLPSSTVQAPDVPDWKAFVRGAVAWLALAVLVVAVAGVVQGALLRLPGPWAAVLLGLALKPLFAWRMLRTEVQAVEAALQGSLEQGRARLGWLVSRDVSQLTESQVRESAIESLAENLNDSVVAPLFWFVLLGLPGAALYRLANTADAMWGYRGVYQGRRWEWAGKWAARVDDGLSWLPARLTAGALALVGGGVPPRALVREAGHTPSPNSGWPMAAMALTLGVCLHKPGVYALNRVGRAPQTADTARALLLASNGLVALVSIAVTATFLVAIVQRFGGGA